ncbi:uncharacterized protein LOC132201636 [Neocloeon triangulifer]|uniref:uncharacterized protein LOC132201636 n=1 Tax=Neocloeon triangulifer TaxID=2078957 RepID=UPI00286F2BA6|nr:uncharacterized protein LOC132201636 [Neocloeon triangulifer]XP_059483933.1 uncharacterized protein LOC132201636 [Neocloeon triangulifer]
MARKSSVCCRRCSHEVCKMTTSVFAPSAAFRSPGMQHRGFPARMDSSFYTTTGWSTNKSKRRGDQSDSGSSSSTTASNAAVSALALLSFLFFLNMLQQNLSAGQQQTLLFMVNNTGTTTGNATRLTANRRRRPLIAVAQVKAKQGFNGRTRLTIKTMKNMKIRKRRPRSMDDDLERKHVEQINDYGDLSEAPPPFMMPGLPEGDFLQLSAWLKGQLTSDELQNDLIDTMTNCRALVACSMRKVPGQARNVTILQNENIRQILIEAGFYAEADHLDEACDDLQQLSGKECNALAASLSKLLPTVQLHTPKN